jgi:hypothetical protein
MASISNALRDKTIGKAIALLDSVGCQYTLQFGENGEIVSKDFIGEHVKKVEDEERPLRAKLYVTLNAIVPGEIARSARKEYGFKKYSNTVFGVCTVLFGKDGFVLNQLKNGDYEILCVTKVPEQSAKLRGLLAEGERMMTKGLA